MPKSTKGLTAGRQGGDGEAPRHQHGHDGRGYALLHHLSWMLGVVTLDVGWHRITQKGPQGPLWW